MYEVNETLNISEQTGTKDSWLQDAELMHAISVTVFCVFSVIAVIGILANGVVLAALLLTKQKKNSTHILILNLAISDLLFVSIGIPFTAADYILPSWIFGNLWCKIVQFVIYTTASCSVYTVVLMSLDRFIGAVHPIFSITLRTQKNTKAVIVVLWLVILVTCTPILLSHGQFTTVTNSTVQHSCRFLAEEGWNQEMFHIGFTVGHYIVPLILIAILYIKIMCSIWKSSRVVELQARRRVRATRLVVFVVVAFLVCWCPIHVIYLLKCFGFYNRDFTGAMLQVSANTLAYTNSCINPILYAFWSPTFMDTFRGVFGLGSSRQGQQEQTLQTRNELLQRHTVSSTAACIHQTTAV